MWSQTALPLSYSLRRSKSESIADDCIKYLKKLYSGLSEEQLKRNGLRYMAFIPGILDRVDGKFNSPKKYAPPDAPKSYEELFDGYAKYHKKQLASLTCSPEDDTRTASDMLILIDSSGDPDDFLKLYEKHCKYQNLRSLSHIDAARIYMYNGDNDRAAEALLDYALLGWYPMESTDVLPASMLDADDLFPIISDKMLLRIYSEPIKPQNL